jgi:hypothetical protein
MSHTAQSFDLVPKQIPNSDSGQSLLYCDTVFGGSISAPIMLRVSLAAIGRTCLGAAVGGYYHWSFSVVSSAITTKMAPHSFGLERGSLPLKRAFCPLEFQVELPVYHACLTLQNVHSSRTHMSGLVPDSSFQDCDLQLGCDVGMGKSRWIW